MKAAALPLTLFCASALAMSVATVLEEPPAAPTNLRSLPAKILRVDWTRKLVSGPEESVPQIVYETTDLKTWTVRTNLPGTARRWEDWINRFESHRFFTVVNAPLTNQ